MTVWEFVRGRGHSECTECGGTWSKKKGNVK